MDKEMLMEKHGKILRTMDKARLGSRVLEKEWDQKIVPKTLKEVAKEFGLLKTCDINNPINTDPELADRFWQAGWEAALRLGFYCPDTETIIKVDEDELKKEFAKVPSSFKIGQGKEERTIAARKPSDGHAPIFTAPLSIQMDEELYIPLVQGIASSQLIDFQEGPSLDTVMGSPLLADTPYETFAGIYEYHLRKEAQKRAGREGMGNALVSSASTHFGFLSGFNLYEMPQIALCLNPASLKINYTTLHKCFVANELGGVIRSESPTMIGGYTGAPETTAIASIATDILQFPICGAALPGSPSYDIRYAGNCGRHGVWTQSIATQAVTRNSNIILMKTINQVSGPSTDMFFLESIVGMTAASASGQAFTISPRSAGGSKKNHLTPIEAWYNAAVFKGAAGLSLEQANDICKEVIPKFEDQLFDPPKGKSFRDLFDIDTLTPIPEYKEQYLKMRAYAQSLGIPMPADGVIC
ncbi:MAG: monomethylamine:corrinoid methyltransferase [Clostridiales bacterium]|nr:monomethylamine:corrinoid methyltransferase [Clostridiales bacterium]MDY3746542.1 monomethylamine:corrinoid methyltransferase [Lachnospiraceae bacterium]